MYERELQREGGEGVLSWPKWFSDPRATERERRGGREYYHDQSDYMKINKLRISWSCWWPNTDIMIGRSHHCYLLNINSVLMIILSTLQVAFSYVCLSWPDNGRFQILSTRIPNSYCVLFNGTSCCILHKMFLNQSWVNFLFSVACVGFLLVSPS